MSHTLAIRVLFIGALTTLIFGGLVMSHGMWSTVSEANIISTQNVWVKEANLLTGTKYGFVLNEAHADTLLGDFMCSQDAPDKPSDVREGQYTYCQNSGDGVKVSLAWKELELKKELFLKRTANTVAEYTRKEGEYQCREDQSFVSDSDIYGIVSDCVVNMTDGSSYYASAYFFYPDNASGMSHVLYAYSLKGAEDQKEVAEVVRSIASGVSKKTKKLGFFDFTLLPVALAQDSGGGDGGGDSGGGGGDSGGGSGGGDAGGGCGCGDGSGDTGGSTGGGEGGSPGDTGSGGGEGCVVDCPTDGPSVQDPIIRDDNLPPRVNAGPDIRITLPQMSTRITGASASDPEGGPLSLRWIRSSSLSYASLIANGTTISPTMSRLVTPGSYVFTLVAEDSYGFMNSDTMVIIVEPEGTINEPDDPTDGGGGSGGGGSGGGDTGGDGSGDNTGDPAGAGPQVWSDKSLVRLGDDATISWDTNNGDESRCTLKGGELGSSHSPIPHTTRDNETGFIVTDIHGRTTFVLDCEGERDSVTVDIIPDIKES